MNYNTTLSIRILDIKGTRDLRASIKRELESKADAANKARLRAMNAVKSRGAGRTGRLFSGPKFNVKQEIKNEPESSNSALLKGISSTNAYGFIFNGPDAKQTRPCECFPIYTVTIWTLTLLLKIDTCMRGSQNEANVKFL